MPWIPRGLREGIVTSRYPRRPDGYGQGFRGAVTVLHRPALSLAPTGEDLCPTGAISMEDGGPHLDQGRCILCGRCVGRLPNVFAFDPGFETAATRRESLVVPEGEPTDESLASARAELARRVRALRRSVHVRHVDAGSDGAEEWEVAALTNPIYDVQRLGIYFTASPRHADLLLVTGVGALGMLGPLQETYDVMPDPKVVIAAGVDAVSGGLIGAGYASVGGVADVVPVDVFVPGSPPTPFGLLFAILLAIGRLPGGRMFPNDTSSRKDPARAERTALGLASAEDPRREASP